LASQPAVFPIEDALTQLETLTRALNDHSSQLTPPHQPQRQSIPSVTPPRSTTAAPQPQETPPHRAAPPLQPVQRDVAPNQLEEPRVQEQAGSLDSTQQPAWEGFLAAIQKEKISVFFALKSGRLLELTDTSLLIGVDKDPYFKELTRKENLTLLEATAKRLFGRPVTVEVKKGGTVVSPPAPTNTAAASSSQRQPLAQSQTPQASSPPQKLPTEDDPLVKTVLDVLGGEVHATLSHRASSEPPR
jgi:hypothetical protein